MRTALALVLHAHQPVGNFDDVIEAAYRSAYLPFVEAAARRPWLRCNLHFSGFLLDWLAQRHPDYLDRLRALIAAGRLELLGGGYYEPILATIPPEHQRLQLDRLAAALLRHFGVRPRGIWLAERVWEPVLPAVLGAAGVEFTLLDDSHFELAGIPAAGLHGYWFTEDQGWSLRVLPSNQFLRNAIPFRPESEAFQFLADAQARGTDLLTMGDDLEKFGSWPHTHQHVYVEGWLERFFDGLERMADSVETVCLGDWLADHPARGLLYLPTASYPEMMGWAHSASWRGFLTRYPEANLLHKSVWDLARRLRAAPASAPLAAAQDALLGAECNDAYWHGWFGGLYSPHLRNQAFTRLLAADAALAAAGLDAPPLRRFDLHGDGGEILELRSADLRLLLDPADGATIAELDHRPTNANLVNSLQRRPEAYHRDLRDRVEHNPAALPGAAARAAAELAEHLLYDHYARALGRLYLFSGQPGFADFQHLRLKEDALLAAGAYEVSSAAAEAGAVQALLARGPVQKRFRLQGDTLSIEVECGAGDATPALEAVFNLLASAAPDRWLAPAGAPAAGRRRLDWSGELPPGPLELGDGWRGFRLQLDAPGARAWWVAPVETVSQSEAGFETLYQGTVLMAVWPPQTRALALRLKIFR